MVKKTILAITLFFSFLPGCTTVSTAGPFIRQIKTGADGGVSIERCEVRLEQWQLWMVSYSASVSSSECHWERQPGMLTANP
jgi:hypothetical protein